ncbi:hypothetical protein D3C86_1057050 [compost metagenome]
MAVAHPVLPEAALGVSRGRDPPARKRHHPEHVALAARVLDAEEPALARGGQAPDALVAARVHPGRHGAVAPHDRKRPIDGVALGDRSQVELHARLREADALHRIEANLPVTHLGAGLGDTRGGRHLVIQVLEAPGPDQGPDRRVEGPARLFGVSHGAPHEAHGLGADRHPALGGLAVDARELAFRAVGAEALVQALHLGEGLRDRRFGMRTAGLDRPEGAHGIADLRENAALLGRRGRTGGGEERERQEGPGGPNASADHGKTRGSGAFSRAAAARAARMRDRRTRMTRPK